MEINRLQNQVDEWIKTFGIRYFNELTNMAILTEEVGEVARIIARRYGEQSEKESDKNKDLGEELADVLFVTLCLANQTGIDLQESFNEKIRKNTERDTDRHLQNQKLKFPIPHMRLMANQQVEIGGSKSISNRLLILQKLFEGIEIERLGNAEDVVLLKNVLNQESNLIDIHHAGTAMRFLVSYFAIQPSEVVTLTGSSRMKQRPIKPLVDALRTLGADIEYIEKDGFPPLKIRGKEIEKNEVKISANMSSQFITSLMLIGAALPKGLIIELKGKITSLPYLKMTFQLLQEVGIEARWESHNKIEIPAYNRSENQNRKIYKVEGDWSSASYFYSLVAIGKKPLRIKGFNKSSLQGDACVSKLYQDFFGVRTIFNELENELLLEFDSSFSYPKSITLDMNDCPDIAQTLCVTAATLRIPFHITGLETLKIKETDRLLALKNELKKIGCVVEITDTSIQSQGFSSPEDSPIIKTYQDHRMAMAFAPFALVKSIDIEAPSVVEKSYPNFWKDFYKVCQPIQS